MKHIFGKIIVVALGGSIVFSDKIDWGFLREFRKFLIPLLRKKKFILIIGGGRLARFFQEAAHKVKKINNEDKDWLGIHATRLNAHLLRTVFRDVADPVVIDSRHRIKKLRYPVTIASGWRPGWSTDFVSVAIAADFRIPEVIVAGKPSYVYDKDRSKHGDAKPIKKLTWGEYRKLIPPQWKPGLHAPVDPVAARLAAKKKISAIIINGRNLKNFTNLLAGRNFHGTVIS